MVIVYKIIDIGNSGEDYSWYGDQDDIIEYLSTHAVENYGLTEKDIKDKGWIWGLEKSGLTYKEIYDKD